MGRTVQNPGVGQSETLEHRDAGKAGEQLPARVGAEGTGIGSVRVLTLARSSWDGLGARRSGGDVERAAGGVGEPGGEVGGAVLWCKLRRQRQGSS